MWLRSKKQQRDASFVLLKTRSEKHRSRRQLSALTWQLTICSRGCRKLKKDDFSPNCCVRSQALCLALFISVPVFGCWDIIQSQKRHRSTFQTLIVNDFRTDDSPKNDSTSCKQESDPAFQEPFVSNWYLIYKYVCKWKVKDIANLCTLQKPMYIFHINN